MFLFEIPSKMSMYVSCHIQDPLSSLKAHIWQDPYASPVHSSNGPWYVHHTILSRDKNTDEFLQ